MDEPAFWLGWTALFLLLYWFNDIVWNFLFDYIILSIWCIISCLSLTCRIFRYNIVHLVLVGVYLLSVYNYVEISTTCLCFSWLITEGRRRGRRSAAPKVVRVRQSDLHARPFGAFGSKIWFLLTCLGSLVFTHEEHFCVALRSPVPHWDMYWLKLVWCEVCPDSCSVAPPRSVTLSCQLRIWHLYWQLTVLHSDCLLCIEWLHYLVLNSSIRRLVLYYLMAEGFQHCNVSVHIDIQSLLPSTVWTGAAVWLCALCYICSSCVLDHFFKLFTFQNNGCLELYIVLWPSSFYFHIY